MTRPHILFGGASIGEPPFDSVEKVKSLLEILRECGIESIDTAAIYPFIAQGKSEELLGESHASQLGFSIDTKLKATGPGSLKPSSIEESLTGSLSRLNANVNVLYCHAPDVETPLGETAAALHEHYSQNKFKKLGLSNYSQEQIESFLDICEKNGYVKPNYYQGQYNALCRHDEDTFLPMLRKNKISYIAYSPLAGGFLTGIFTQGTDVKGTRFEEGNLKGNFFKQTYDKPGMHSAVRKLQASLDSHGIGLAEASLRWLCYDSALGEGDGVILGASKASQVQQNAKDIAKGPLPRELLGVFEEMWKLAREGIS